MNNDFWDRRRFVGRLTAAGFLAATSPLAGNAFAQPAGYPDRPLRLALPLGPGSANDIVARVLAAALAQRLKKPVVVENHPGGGGIIGTGVIARAPADGYTIGFGTLSTLVANAALYTKLPFDIERDLVPVALVTRAPLLLLANPKSPGKTLQEILRYAKANPGKVTYASAGIGSINHVGTELLQERAGVKMLHVPYKSNGPALIGLAGGEVDLLFDTAISVAAMRAKGLVTVVAAGGAQRLRAFPDVPSFAESGVPDYDADTWTAVVAPRATPVPILEFLRAEINAVLMDPAVRTAIEKTGSEVLQFPTAEATETFVAAQRQRWVPLIRSLKIEMN